MLPPTITLTEPQTRIFEDNSRFRAVVAGRRFGKTYLSVPELLKMAWGPNREVWYVAPTYRQAKQIAWRRLKAIARPWIGGNPNESDLSITLKWGSIIALRGANNYDSLRGPGLDGLILDEYADIPQEAWTEVLRPMLSDKGKEGRALFIGTPKGQNHFFDLFQDAKTSPGWRSFHYTTLDGGNVSPEEVAAARHDLNEKAFRQEYEASFENYAGLAYHAFSADPYPTGNIARCEYDPALPLCWALDFNVDPMCSVIAQIAEQFERSYTDVLTGKTDDESRRKQIRVLDEICLPDSSTQAAAQEFIRRTEPWARKRQLEVVIYGDASGHSRKTTGPVDYRVIEEILKADGRYRFSNRSDKSNPGVRDRVTTMNNAFLNAAGERRLLVDPQCKELRKDLLHMRWKRDLSGNPTNDLDESNRERSHVSSALGYMVWKELGMKRKGGFMGGPYIA